MSKEAIQIFSLLDENEIDYYLLRAIDLSEEVKDLDVIIPLREIERLKTILIAKYGFFYERRSHANGCIELLANDMLIDIKFTMCFLPGKSLSLPINLKYAGIKYLRDSILIPNIESEILFTYWTLHMFLDKKCPGQSSTFEIYKEMYEAKGNYYLNSDYFKKIGLVVFEKQFNEANEYLKNYFINDTSDTDLITGKKLKNLVFKNRPLLSTKFFIDKIKYAAYRRLGIDGTYRKITEFTRK